MLPSRTGDLKMKKTPTLSMLRPVALPLAMLSLALILGATATDVMAGGSRATGATTDQLMVYNGNRFGTDIGDFITTCSGSCTLSPPTVGNGLDLPYTYFLEVPPGLSRLVVELFDPDILAAADPNDERDNDRDLLRSTLNTYARYRLFDPDGNQVATSLGVGGNDAGGAPNVSTPNPVAWDNAWVTFYDSDRVGATPTTTFIDNFGAISYANDNGSGTFATSWTETGETGTAGPTGGIMQVTGGALSISNVGDAFPFLAQPRIHRQVNLSTLTNANVSFDWGTGTGMEDNDAIIFEVSNDGGVSWVGMDIFSNFASGAASGSASYDITDYIATNTQVRFRIFDNFAGAGEAFTVDNFTISAGTTADGAAPAAGHWTIEMDMSTEIKDRDFEQEELNALGIRAHDGDSTSGGSEVNVYALSYFSMGLNNNNRSRSYTMYPYITEGCEIDVNEFDYDAMAPDPDGVGGIDAPYGSWDLTSREGFTDDEAGTLSANNSWNSETVTGFNDDTSALDYGIWTMDMDISDFGSGNYAVYYIGHEDATAPAPSGSPEANSARIYFPTDDNMAPAKPYATHTVRYEGTGNGPNPPVMGSVTTFALTVRVVNPTGSIGSISFDNAASRTVTAQVPASTGDFELTYQGLPTGFPTSGTIISQPTVGSTTGGTITWEPADIAAGADAVMVYEFDIEPLVATDPLTIPVSGTYLSNGTAISFLDETGDVSGAFTLGPLCGLAIIAGPNATSTPVLVSNFEARPARGGTLLEWTTAAEAGSASFDLYRHGPGNVREKVNNQTLLALLDAPQGGVYRFIDFGAAPEDANTYSLVEHTATGRQIQHGPFTVQVRWDLPQLDVAGGYERNPHPLTSRAVDGPSALTPSPELIAAAGSQRVITSGLASNDALWVTTGAAGIYELTATELATHFGLSEQDLRRLIQNGKLSITHGGQPVPWQQNLNASTVRFHAEANDSIYSNTQAFRVTLDSGRRMSTIRGDEPSADWQPDAFRDTVRGEENLRPVVLAPLDPTSDIWFWDFLRNGDATHGTKDFTFDLPSVADVAATADLTVHLQGVSPGQHTLDVSVNGQFVGSVSVNDLDASHLTLPVSQSLLNDGSNTVQLSATAGDLVFVDAFEVAYDRLYGSQSDALLSRADGNDRIAVGGFTDPSITVYDLRRDGNPRVVNGVRRILDGGTYRAIWEPAGPQVPYLAVSDAGVLTPLGITVDTPSNLRSSEMRGEHVILAPSSLVATAESLAVHRRNLGFQSTVVDLQDVYDEFNHGMVDLNAVRDFLQYAVANWQIPPRYVVLAGAGTYDYLDHLGLGDNLLPPFLRSDGETLFVSDAPFADFDGDGVTDIALGRLPVVSSAELQTLIDKLVAYESLDEPEWGSQVILASDNADVADFAATSDAYGDLLSAAYQGTEIHLEDFASLVDARQALFDALDSGAAVLNYLGHGGVDRLAAEGLLTNADVPTLTNDGLPTVLLAVSCHIGFHGLPGFDSLGEHLLLDPTGGAAAVWAPSWLSQHNEARVFGDRIFRQLFVDEERTLGDAILEGLRGAATLGVDTSLLETYQLLGDPAMKVQLVPDYIPGGPPCEPNCSGG